MSPKSNIPKWIPLESNPEIYKQWSIQAGLIEAEANFHDVYGLDDELLAFVPQPVRAVVLIFPDTEGTQKRIDEDERISKEGQPKLDKTIMFIKQTIRNACGTMALIHALANSDVTLSPMSPLSEFLQQCQDKTPMERAHILETTNLFTDIHKKLASTGQSSIPADLETDLHFLAFVAAPDEEWREKVQAGTAGQADGSTSAPDAEDYSGMRLVELDGEREGPIDRGECKDLLKDVARYVKEKIIGESSSIQFNLIALGGPAPGS